MKRRRNREGSFYFDKAKNLYRFRIQFKDAAGIIKTKTISGKKKEDVDFKATEFIKSIDNYRHPIDNNITLQKFGEQWLKSEEKILAPKTLMFYRTCLINHLYPAFGERKLKSIKPMELNAFFANLAEKPAGNKAGCVGISTIKAVYRTGNRLFSVAIQNGLTFSNPFSIVKLPKTKKIEKLAIDEEQMKNLLSIANSNSYLELQTPEDEGQIFLRKCIYYFLYLDCFTGMRAGELIGLQWNKILWDEHKIKVNQQAQYIPAQGTVFRPCKSEKSNRLISIDEVTLSKLHEWKIYQDEYAKKFFGVFKNKNNLVFPSTYGTFLTITNIENRFLKKIVRTAGISEKFSLHNIRHSHGSILKEKGVDIQVISERLGHNDVITTLKIYSHTFPKMHDKAVEILAALHP